MIRKIFKGTWKYIAPQEKPVPEWLKNKKVESGLEREPQLYDLQRDPGEVHNVANQHPEIVKALKAELKKLIL
jgi:arylsulfatase A